MNTYTIYNRSCSLQVYARGNFGNQTGILFLHGGPGSGAKPIMDLPAFQKLEIAYPCIYFDQRGSGSSQFDIEEGLELDDLVSDVLVVAEDMKKRWNLTSIFLWGGSFGGYLAALCLEQHQDIFTGAILSSPAITFDRAQALAMFERMQAPYQARFPKPLLDQEDQGPLLPETFFALPQIRRLVFSKENPSQSLRHICAMSHWFFAHPFPNLFSTLHIPTLLLQGKDDPVCVNETLEQAYRQANNPNLYYRLFEHCGHAIFTDQEAAFVNVMDGFMEEMKTRK